MVLGSGCVREPFVSLPVGYQRALVREPPHGRAVEGEPGRSSSASLASCSPGSTTAPSRPCAWFSFRARNSWGAAPSTSATVALPAAQHRFQGVPDGNPGSRDRTNQLHLGTSSDPGSGKRRAASSSPSARTKCSRIRAMVCLSWCSVIAELGSSKHPLLLGTLNSALILRSLML